MWHQAVTQLQAVDELQDALQWTDTPLRRAAAIISRGIGQSQARKLSLAASRYQLGGVRLASKGSKRNMPVATASSGLAGYPTAAARHAAQGQSRAAPAHSWGQGQSLATQPRATTTTTTSLFTGSLPGGLVDSVVNLDSDDEDDDYNMWVI